MLFRKVSEERLAGLGFDTSVHPKWRTIPDQIASEQSAALLYGGGH